uniref:Uncharacterized protein n=1 Tax=Glycine max TaxID=3847 RepID=C6TDK6_SOYBN|nr:unknown [Glycine max]
MLLHGNMIDFLLSIFGFGLITDQEVQRCISQTHPRQMQLRPNHRVRGERTRSSCCQQRSFLHLLTKTITTLT